MAEHPKQLVLSSASPRRAELLERMGLRFQIHPCNVVEDDSGLNGRKLPVADGRAADFAIVVGASDAGDGASWYLVE